MTVCVQTNADNPQTIPMSIKGDSQKNYSCLPPQLISGSGPESLAGDLKFSPLHLPSPAFLVTQEGSAYYRINWLLLHYLLH